MEKEEVRKGPWTEQEDVQLVLYVNLFGDRRWDFVAKVSGLKRTGKSCRLRWVNYLHPDLKRGKMTPNEERLVLQLHTKWGNRWSRIARKLPGRTDNEIKNYWRTHMRKKAQEKKKQSNKHSNKALSPSTSSSSSSSSSSNYSSKEFAPAKEIKDVVDAPGEKKTGLEVEESAKVYSMDDIWKEFEFSEKSSCDLTALTVASPVWDYCPTDSLWSMDEEERKMWMQPLLGGGDHHFHHAFPFG